MRFGKTIDSIKSLSRPAGILNKASGEGESSRVLITDKKADYKGPMASASGSGSSNLLANIKKRRKSELDPTEKEEKIGTKLLDDLVTFLWSSGGSSASEEGWRETKILFFFKKRCVSVIAEFKHRLSSPEETFAFRAMLRQVADCSNGIWKLKKNFAK